MVQHDMNQIKSLLEESEESEKSKEPEKPEKLSTPPWRWMSDPVWINMFVSSELVCVCQEHTPHHTFRHTPHHTFRQEHTQHHTNVWHLYDIRRHVNLSSYTNMYIHAHRHMRANTRVTIMCGNDTYFYILYRSMIRTHYDVDTCVDIYTWLTNWTFNLFWSRAPEETSADAAAASATLTEKSIWTAMARSLRETRRAVTCVIELMTTFSKGVSTDLATPNLNLS